MSKTVVSRTAILAAVDAYAEAYSSLQDAKYRGTPCDLSLAQGERNEALNKVVTLVDSLNLPMTFAELAEQEQDLVALYRAAKRARGPADSLHYQGVFDALKGARDALHAAAQVARLDPEEFIRFLDQQEG